MSSSGFVKVWKHDYGLVEMEDGTVVRIDKSEIKNGTLRVGRAISFDKDDSEKPKGTNASGEAILEEGGKLTEEQEAEDKKLFDEIRAKEDKKLEDMMVLVNQLSKTSRKLLAKELMVKFPIVKKEEKRLDGKQAFTKGEFVAYYGEKEGSRKWKSAEVSQKGDKRKRERRPRGEKKEKSEEKKEAATEEKKEE